MDDLSRGSRDRDGAAVECVALRACHGGRTDAGWTLARIDLVSLRTRLRDNAVNGR
jgi:hypothetical protein